LSVLHKIINLTTRQTGTDLTKLARWLRCLFNLSLQCDEETSLKCIEQVTKIVIAQQGVSPSSSQSPKRAIVKPTQDHNIAPVSLLITPPPSSDPSPDEFGTEIADDELKAVDQYPTTELEWLATTAFNHGVDYFLREEDKKCKFWAEKAFVLAQWLDDKGALRDDMMERYASLQLKE
jgi:hypothetical protein